jgi:hypothetical protein
LVAVAVVFTTQQPRQQVKPMAVLAEQAIYLLAATVLLVEQIQ